MARLPWRITSGQPDPATVERILRHASAGFQPLEELHGLWPGLPCLIMIKTV